jgi:hypothetical protein
VVKVHRGEGLASRTSPEPCMASREGRGEASVGKTRKPAIVPRKSDSFRDADGEGKSEGNTSPRDIASAEMVPRGLRTWRAWKSSAREPGEITTGQRYWPASGRRTRRSR